MIKKIIFMVLLSFLLFSCRDLGGDKHYVTVHYMEAKENATKPTDVTSKTETFKFVETTIDSKKGKLEENVLIENFNKGKRSGVQIGSENSGLYGTIGVGRLKSGKTTDYNNIAKTNDSTIFDILQLNDDINDVFFNFGEDIYIIYAPPQ